MDLGRLPEARYRVNERFLSDREVTQDDIDFVIARIGTFGDDNRAGIPRTLHRISGMRNRAGRVIGLTCRIGRAVFGTITILRDLVDADKSVLLLGKPGVGKTTLLRETARVLAEELRKRVVIVDTSNEIAGDGDVPHPGIGRARRMQVPRPSEQHGVMIEAVENHMPEVIVIDEIGTELEALAARTIAERGVQLIGTAHGQTLDNLLSNPTLSDLIGGIQAVTLGDEEARRRGTQKTVLERKAPPTFDMLVEIQSWDRMIVYQDVASAVDDLLRGEEPLAEQRSRDADGQVISETFHRPPRDGGPENGMFSPMRGGVDRDGREPRDGRADRNGGRNNRSRNGRSERNGRVETAHDDRGERSNGRENRSESRSESRSERNQVLRSSVQAQRIYPFGISRDRLERAIASLRVPATIVRNMNEATMVMTLKNYYRQGSARVRQAEEGGVPVYVLRNNTSMQMERQLTDIFHPSSGGAQPIVVEADEPEDLSVPIAITRPAELRAPAEPQVNDAMLETETAITRVLNGERDAIELMPASSYVRRLQHQLAERYNVQSESRGREPNRRVKIYR